MAQQTHDPTVSRQRIKCAGLTGTVIDPLTGQDVPVGQWLKSYDPDAHDGRGFAEWTANEDEAMTFDSFEAAFQCWHSVSVVRPRRDDGMPNRPLTAFDIQIEGAK